MSLCHLKERLAIVEGLHQVRARHRGTPEHAVPAVAGARSEVRV
jgi:hypothetical protein